MAATEKQFKTEVQQLLDLVIHSLYSNKDIFLRELISNASDAIDRARFESLSKSDVLEDDPEWKIKITPDKEAKTLTISDNGIGMTAEEVEANIGTIANSGTRKFLEQVRQAKAALPPELIGQFGVGFYAAFMVADKVTVTTRPAGDKTAATRWESTGAGSYTVETVTREKRGTDVVLHLKDEAGQYLEEWEIRKIVKRFSDFVEHPVTMDIRREETPRDENGKVIEGAETKVTINEETLNSRRAIWQRPKNEIKDDEYNEFYRHVSHDFTDPLEVIHWNVEGQTEFRALLYLPERPPFNLFMPEERNRGVQLYVKRIFITDNCEELTPQYLRFLRGVVDSSDLPLNISRELLQENRLIRLIRSNLVRKVLDTLADMRDKNRDKYVTFWKAFGSVLKEGMHVDLENREKLQELLLFESSHTETGAFTTLKEYVERMGDKQKEIYYITGDDRTRLEQSPHLEAVRKHDLEVLYMTDPVDEWVVQSLTRYADKPLKSVAKGDISLETDEDAKDGETEQKKLADSYKDLFGRIKDILSAHVKEVRVSRRLTDSACCLVSDEHDLGVQMERLMKAMHQDLPPTKRILEVNAEHPLVGAMEALFERDREHAKLTEYAEMLYDQALLTAGLPVRDSLVFARRISTLMALESQGVVTAGADAAATGAEA